MFNRQFLSVLTEDLIFSVEEAKTIGKKDSISDADIAQYYTVMNVWGAMFCEYSPWTGYYAKEAITRFGLKKVVREANKVSSRLIKALPTGIDSEIDKLIAEGNSFGIILDEIRKMPPVMSMFDNAKGMSSSFEVPQIEIILQLLRFPKRLTFSNGDKSQSYKDFKQWDNRNKLRDRNGDHPYLLYVRDILNELVPWKRIIKSMSKVNDYYMPSGTTAEGYKSYGEKLNAILPYKRSIFGIHPPIPKRIRNWECHSMTLKKEISKYDCLHLILTKVCGKFPDGRLKHVRIGQKCLFFERRITKESKIHCKGTVARLSAVPKNLDESRIIAMEAIVSQGRAIALLPIWYDYVDELGILLLEQDKQGELAIQGSRWDMQDDPFCPCTIDSHRASDSITKGQQRTIFPAEYLNIVEEVLPWAYVCDNTLNTLYGAATSGNALTFIHECLFFKAAGVLGCILAYPLFFAESCPPLKKLSQWVTVVGDDLIVPAFAYDTTLHVLQRLGIKANDDKSYGPGSPFRESCGYDAVNGEVVSSIYWPRHPITGTVEKGKVSFSSSLRRDFDPLNPAATERLVDSVGVLIDLQRGLYRTFPKAATILGQILLKSHPNLVSRPTPLNTYDIIGTCNVTDKHRTIECQIWDLDGKYKTSHMEEREFVLNKCAVPSVERVLPSIPKDSEYELLRYACWLYNGPEYFDPVCELAGCSRPSTFSIVGMFGTPTITWRRRLK